LLLDPDEDPEAAAAEELADPDDAPAGLEESPEESEDGVLEVESELDPFSFALPLPPAAALAESRLSVR